MSRFGGSFRLLAMACLPLLAACSKQDAIQLFAPAEDQAIAREYIDDLRRGDLLPIERDLDPSLARGDVHSTLVRMAAQLPQEAPRSVKVVGAQVLRRAGRRDLNLTFEYEFPSRWALINVATRRQGGKLTIVGLHVNFERTSLEDQFRFGLTGKSPLQYTILALAVGFPLLTLYALIECVRSKLRGRKWPWVIFVLVGFVRVGVNWTTGAWVFQLVAVQLFSASAAAQFYGPWIISVSLPLGAILFLLLRRSLMLRPVAAEPSSASPSA